MTIRYIYLWETIICIGSLIIYGVVVAFFGFCFVGIIIAFEEGIDSFDFNDFIGFKEVCKLIMYILLGIIAGIPSTACGIAIGSIFVGLIMVLSFIALVVVGTLWTLIVFGTISNRERLDYNSRQFYYDNLEWIIKKSDKIQDENGNTMITKKQNKVIKLCVINQEILKNKLK